MARPLRVEFPDAEYHVTARGNERRPIFRDDEDRRCFLETVGEMAAQFSVLVRVFCLMPNHYHLVVATPRANLSRAVGWLQTVYTIRFNRRHRRCGHLFQGRFKAQLVEADDYAISLIRYIHLNPVRVRAMSGRPVLEKQRILDAFPWSSHRSYAGLATDASWLTTDWMRYYGATRRVARSGYRQDIGESLAAKQDIPSPWSKLRGGLVLGGESLWKRARNILGQKGGDEEIRWKRLQDQVDRAPQWQKRIEDEPDDRWKIWLRVRALGQRKIDVARDLGYRDGSSVLQVLKRLEAQALKDKSGREKMRKYEILMSSVES